jgi:thymidylate kinase
MGGALVENGPPVIEFLGLPGAGKSTLARRLLSRLAARGMVCGDLRSIARFKDNRPGHYARLVKFAITRTRHLRPAAKLAAAVTPWSIPRWWFAVGLSLWSYRLAMVRKRKYDAVVLDHGPLQSAWCVLLEGSLDDERVLGDVLSRMLVRHQLTFAFVHVDIAPELAAARIEARGPMAAPFNRGRAETQGLLALHRKLLEQVLGIAEQRIGGPVLRLDGSLPLEENDRRIDVFVDQLMGSTVETATKP